MTNLIGKQLGNYHIIRLLGTGGCAEVYLGEHIHLKRQAAIKVLRPMLQDAQKEDFFIEAQRLVDLSHPSIIPIFDFAIEGDLPYLIMGYAPNGTLRTRHPAGSRLPLSTVVSYVKCIATPLQYLHDQKLIHRDVKPENLLLGKNQEILLSDLGIAAIAHTTSSLGMQGLAGTPPYMSPEQAEGVPRAASDQYTLGIVAYEWLCGTVPFQSTSVMGFVTQHLSAPPPSLCQRIPTLPLAVEQVILKALAKKPQQRFPTIMAFAEALEEASQIKPTVAAISRVGQNPLPSSVFHTPTVLLSEPMQKPSSASKEVMPLRNTQPLKLVPQHVEWAPDYAPTQSDVISRPVAVSDRSTVYRHQASKIHPSALRAVAVSDRSTVYRSHKPYASPTTKSTARSKRKALSYIIGAVPLLVLILSVSIAGFANYWTSHAAMKPSTTPPSPVHQTPTTPSNQQNVLATDTFQRPDQALWGKTSAGYQWDGDASTNPSFSINGSTGQIAGGQGPLEALIGPSTDNVDVTVSGFVNQFSTNMNFGVVLRWTDTNNWYKAFINGSQLVILRSVNGQSTIISQMAVATQAGVLQRLRFSALGTTLSAKVWPNTANEPKDWMLTVDDHTFTTGRFGIRVVEQTATVITVISFNAVKASAENAM